MYRQSQWDERQLSRSWRSHWRRVIQWITAFTLMGPSVLSSATVLATTVADGPVQTKTEGVLCTPSANATVIGRMDPRITPIAQKSPQQAVRVIVQKIENSNRVEQLVAKMGGSVLSDFTGLAASQLLLTGELPVNWSSVNWNSVNWNSVNWNSAVLEPPRIGGILPLAEGESWETPPLPTELPELIQEEQLDQQSDNYLFLPAVVDQ